MLGVAVRAAGWISMDLFLPWKSSVSVEGRDLVLEGLGRAGLPGQEEAAIGKVGKQIAPINQRQQPWLTKGLAKRRSCLPAGVPRQTKLILLL